MTEITLTIQNPRHDEDLIGAAAANVNLRGVISGAAPGTLFYKWYSSLYIPPGMSTAADAPKAALNWPNHAAPTALNFNKVLAPGTHTLTLAARDVEGDTLADLQAVKIAVMAGGPAKQGVAHPCVFHLLIARILNLGATLSKSSAILEAEAPPKWDVADYQAVNRLRFHWRFEPSGGGAPIAGLPALNATPAQIQAFQDGLTFGQPDATHTTTFVRYSGALPAALVVGTTYRLVLRVENKDRPADGDETAQNVTITA